MFAQFGLGNLENPMQLYFEGLEKMAQGMSPAKGVARAQIEMMGLMSRRAQAYLEIPSRLSRCRSPQDLVTEQMRFWQMAFQQYSETSHKVMESYRQGFAAAAANTSTGFTKPAPRQRDYISFPDPRNANGAARPGQSKRMRVVA